MNNGFKRTTLIYGNCCVYSPDGNLMFRCLKKRAQWYLDRGLAIITSEDPLAIQLNFKPKGSGETDEILKVERENRCVVCGAKDLESLTKHHLIPYEYRRFFPKEKNEHSSIFVVPICRDCHLCYENKHAFSLKSQLSGRYNAPLSYKNGNGETRLRAGGALNTLRKYHNRIPPERIEVLKQIAFKYLFADGFVKSIDELATHESIQNFYDLLKAKDTDSEISHGKMVVERCENIEAFENMWVRHFIETMQPKYMSEYFDKPEFKSYQGKGES